MKRGIFAKGVFPVRLEMAFTVLHETNSIFNGLRNVIVNSG